MRILDTSNINLETLFSPQENFVFLVGAGVSMNAPSSLPSAQEIVKALIELFAPKEEVQRLLELEDLRFELVVEVAKNNIDHDLIFMDYLEMRDKPNIINLFLAHCIKRRDFVITTNFDYLIEYALIQILTDNTNIFPIITKEDYLKYSDPLELVNSGKFPVYKIHGSKKNIITDRSTTDSLVTTLSALGKDREEGEVFAIESYKKAAINNLLKDRTLVMMGYSGSDDFDIGPTLKEIMGLTKVIWINHITENDIKILELNKDLKIEEINENELTNSERLILEISETSRKYQKPIEIFQINAKTADFIEIKLWPLLLENIKFPNVNLEGSQTVDFKSWIQTKDLEIDPLKQYNFAIDIYLNLSQFEDAYRCIDPALKLAKQNEDIFHQANLLNKKGNIYRGWTKMGRANLTMNKAFKIAKKLELSDLKIEIMINKYDMDRIAAPPTTSQSYEKRQLNRYMGVLEMAEKLGNQPIIATLYSRIGLMHQMVGVFKIKARMKKTAQRAFEEALEWYNKALEIENKFGNLINKAKIFLHFGAINGHQKNYPIAFENYNKSLDIAKELGDLALERRILRSFKAIYKAQKNKPKVREFEERIDEITNQLNIKTRWKLGRY